MDLDSFRANNKMEGGGTSVWTGMTIRDILEKVDLVNISDVSENPGKNPKLSSISDRETSPAGKTLISVPDPTSAYLGTNNNFKNVKN